MKLVFSFDDGRSDAFAAHSILVKYGLNGTFHITTGYIDHSFKKNGFANNYSPLTTSQILEMKKNGAEFSSHGDKHKMDVEDFLKSYEKLHTIGANMDLKIGFSIPYSKATNDEIVLFQNKLKNKLLYIRRGRNERCYSFLCKVLYFIYHKFYFYFAYALFNRYNVIKRLEPFNLSSIVIKKDIKPKHVIRFLKKYHDKNVAVVLMFHSIKEYVTDDWDYSKLGFEKICNYVSSDKNIKCITMNELVRSEYEKL